PHKPQTHPRIHPQLAQHLNLEPNNLAGTKRSLRTGTAEPSALTWIGRWLSEGAVFVLTVGMWPLWMTVLVI
ncbi:hypothetical protein, partial [Streptomyces mirabilis]